MRIAIGCDHSGYEEPKPYKPEIVRHVAGRGHEVVDCGTNGPESVDYSDHADKVCAAILNGDAERGILLCGSGLGIGMAANRHKGIRAATCVTPVMASLASSHNDANVIALGQRILSIEQCIEFIDIWLDTPFSGDARHVRRIKKLDNKS